jgi:tetratricopeptide (TPR) repeat protein
MAITAGDNRYSIGENYLHVGTNVLCLGDLDGAEAAFAAALRIFREITHHQAQQITFLHLGRLCLQTGERQAALAHFQKALLHVQPERYIPHILNVLAGLEAAYALPKAFRTRCRRYRAEHPQLETTTFTQWFLEPAKPHRDCGAPIVERRFTEAAMQNQEWIWQDPLGDCSFALQDGLTLYAANGRALWKTNQSAPRFVRPVSGDVIVQTICEPAFPVAECPAIGGLVLWKNGDHFLCLDRGRFGPDDICFSGSLNSQPDFFGRGRLAHTAAGSVYLRLERFGVRVRALCSADGTHWWAVGNIDFPVNDPIEAGVFAVGDIDRLIYPAAYPEGTAVRFTALTYLLLEMHA